MPTVTCLGELEWLHNKQSRTNWLNPQAHVAQILFFCHYLG
jgi:hypothetical protein